MPFCIQAHDSVIQQQYAKALFLRYFEQQVLCRLQKYIDNAKVHTTVQHDLIIEFVQTTQ